MTRFGEWLAEVGRRLRDRICGPVPALQRGVWFVDTAGTVFTRAYPVILPPNSAVEI